MSRKKNPNAYEEKKARLRKRYATDKAYRDLMKKRSSDYYYRVLKKNPFYSDACKVYNELKKEKE